MYAFRFALLAFVVIVAALEAPRFVPELVADLGENPPPPPVPAIAAAPAVEAPPPPPLAETKPAKSPAPSLAITLRADRNRHYSAKIRINGMPVDVMVDTGATKVALTEATARRLALYRSAAAFNQQVSTANGIVAVAPVMLTEVELGQISLREVEAVIVPGAALGTNLLGMSFLGRLSNVTVGDDTMTLTE